MRSNTSTSTVIRHPDPSLCILNRRLIRQPPSAEKMSVNCPIALAVEKKFQVKLRFISYHNPKISGNILKTKFTKQPQGKLSLEETPQLVLITFEDAVNDVHNKAFEMLFNTSLRRNPNGCEIRATFFVSHEWTDYSLVQNLYADGHEIASHTVS